MSPHQFLSVPETLFGVSSNPYSSNLTENTLDFDRLAAAGLNLVRFDAPWRYLEPTTKGTYDAAFYTRIDEIMGLADARSMTLILLFKHTPAWARSGGTYENPPTNRQDYADALGELAAHYADRPGMMYEIWNEPNYISFWLPACNAAEYTDLLQRAYTAAKAADPDCTILGGALNHHDPDYLAAMYAAGAHGYFDAFSFHDYCSDRPIDQRVSDIWDFGPQMEALHAQLVAAGDDVPIWITEFGYNIDPEEYKPVTEAFRAANLPLAPGIVRVHDYVRGACVYTLNVGVDAGNGLTTHGGGVTSSWTAYVAGVNP